MANRFLDSNYFKSPFVRGLKGSLKILYSFIICDCDGAGIWNLDLQAAALYTGYDVDYKEFKGSFIDTGKAIDLGGGKFFFPDFIEHQYPGGLQSNNKAHKNFISTLKKLDLIDENLTVKVKKNIKPLQSPLKGPPKGGQGIGLGIGNGKGLGLGKGLEGGLGGENYLVPKMCKVWYDTFPTYTADKDNDFEGMGKILSFISRQAHLKQIHEPDTQEKVLNTLQLVANEVVKENFWANKSIKSIANNIQEFYNKIKNNNNGDGKQSGNSKAAGSKLSMDKLKEIHAKTYGKSEQTGD